jgi:hypothetical protein
MAEGDDVLREVTSFLDTLSVNPEAAAAPQSAAGSEVDFDVPKGYTSQRDPAGPVVLKPTSIGSKYAVHIRRQSVATVERCSRTRRTGIDPRGASGLAIKRAKVTTRRGALRAPAGLTFGSGPTFSRCLAERCSISPRCRWRFPPPRGE